MKEQKKIFRYSEADPPTRSHPSVMDVIQPRLNAMRETRDAQRQIELVDGGYPTPTATACRGTRAVPAPDFPACEVRRLSTLQILRKYESPHPGRIRSETGEVVGDSEV